MSQHSTLQWEITPTSNATIDAKEIWQYRHLLRSLVKRDFLLVNQQTILGPLWAVFQPLLTLVIYVLIFSRLVGLSTGELPPVLFYYSGIVLWNLFNDCFNGAAGSLKDNAHIFSKVYLPRLVFPISVGITQLLRFVVQFFLLLILIGWYLGTGRYSIELNTALLWMPIAVLLVCIAGLTVGLLSSIVAAKYRDMFNIIAVVIRLMMFATPVIYPVSSIRPELQWVVQINPLSSFFELFRYSLFGSATLNTTALLIGGAATILLFIFAVRHFARRSNQLLDII